MKLKDIVKEYYGNDLDNLINKIPVKVIEIIEELIQMFDLKLVKVRRVPVSMLAIIFNNDANLFKNCYSISITILNNDGLEYRIQIADFNSPKLKVLFDEKSDDFSTLYNKLLKFTEE